MLLRDDVGLLGDGTAWMDTAALLLLLLLLDTPYLLFFYLGCWDVGREGESEGGGSAGRAAVFVVLLACYSLAVALR